MSSPIPICFLIDRLYRGGTELLLLRLIAGLDRSRFSPSLVLLDGAPSPLEAEVGDDRAVLHLGVDRLRNPRFPAAALRLAAFLRSRRVAVLQLHHSAPTALGLAAALFAPRVRLVRTRFNLGYWLNDRSRRIERLAARWCDLTVVNCEAAGAALLAEAPPPAGGIVAIANGVETGSLARLPPLGDGPPPPRRVGLVANLRPVKDPELFVRAAATLASRWPDVTFEIAGDGELRDALSRLAAGLGLEARLRLRLEVVDIARFLGDLDVAVLCSRSEALPNALLEYMAAARPIVATAVGGVPEAVRDGREALLVPPGDVARLAEAIDRLLTDRELGRRLGLAARARCLERYSMTATLRDFSALYSALAAGDGPPLRRAGRAAAALRAVSVRDALAALHAMDVPQLDRPSGERRPVER